MKGDALLWWLLTYTLHSTLLLGGAWLLTLRSIRSESLRDTLWKVALVGGLITATVQVATGWHPSYSIAWGSPVAMVDPVKSLPLAAPGGLNEAADPDVSADASANTASTSISSDREKRPEWSLGVWLLVLWAIGASVALFRLAVARLLLTRRLRSRRPVTAPALLAMLEELGRGAAVQRPIRLTEASGIATPVALGRREICLPPRAMTGLDAEQQRCVLAHEMAHLLRRDPLWLALLGVLESVFFFQPLNRLGRQRLQEVAEYLCDDWAVSQTGGRLTLARCLVEVASWVTPGERPLSLAGMAEGGSPLTERVQRLLADTPPFICPARWPRIVMTAGVLALVAGLGPGVSQEYRFPPQTSEQPATTLEKPGVVSTQLTVGTEAESTESLVPLNTAGQLAYGSGPEDTSHVEWIQGPFWQSADEVHGKIKFHTRGRIEFSPDGTLVRTITAGGYLIVEERDTSDVRRVEVKPAADGGVEYTYSVNGLPHAWDYRDGAQRWLGPLIRELVRVTEAEAEGTREL